MSTQLVIDLKNKSQNPIQQALYYCKQVFVAVFFLAFCINLLMLITPLYSLQVLDRVIGNQSKETLLMLTLLIGSIYLAHSMLQVSRSFALIKLGEWLDNNLSPIIFSNSIASAASQQSLGASQNLRDFQTVKTFLTSTGINTLLDAPWSVAYLIVIFMIHPYLGYLTIIGGIIIITMALINASATSKPLGESSEFSIKSYHTAEIANRNAEVVEAMGMIKNVSKNWAQFNEAALEKQTISTYRNGVVSNISKLVRSIIQMCVTAIGAYVVVTTSGNDMTTGGMIASSIMVGRALAPFDNFIEVYKSINNAMKSYSRLNAGFKFSKVREVAEVMPNIDGKLEVNNLSFALPLDPRKKMMGAKPQYILQEISFAIEAGESLAIIGPSGAGKTSLAKLLMGIKQPTSGNILLDNAEIYNWNRDDFGMHVGYLPQAIELFNGSIKDNIARLNEDIDPQQVTDAAKMAGAHEFILNLPEGYDTDIGVAGSKLSGGQKQRVALARAFYGNPKFVVLDEPNANLDEAGEIALSNALKEAKKRGITTVTISHRPSVLSIVDKVAIMKNGKLFSFGNASEVLNHLSNTQSGTIHVDKDNNQNNKK